MKKTVWTFGLIAGAILSAMMAMTVPFWDRLGYDRSEVIGYTTMVLAFLLVFVGVKSYRDTVLGGTIGFGKAVAVGAAIVVIASACYTATWQVIYHSNRARMDEHMRTLMVSQATEEGGTPEEIAARVAESKQFVDLYQSNPLVNIAITVLEPLPVGIIVVLVSAGVLTRRRRGDDAIDAHAAVASN